MRRIEAVAGMRAYAFVKELENRLERVSEILKTNSKDLEKRVRELLEENSRLQREIKRLRSRDIKSELSAKLKEVKEVKGVKVLVSAFETEKMDELREFGDFFKNALSSGIFFLIGEREGDKLAVCMVTKDLSSRISAGEVFRRLSESLGLKGGEGMSLHKEVLVKKYLLRR